MKFLLWTLWPIIFNNHLWSQDIDIPFNKNNLYSGMNFQYEEQTLNIRTKNYQRNCLHDMVNVFFSKTWLLEKKIRILRNNLARIGTQ